MSTRWGTNARLIREKKGLTQRAVAAAAGIRENTYGAFEKGDPENPEVSTILKIATALGVDVVELFRPSDEVLVEELRDAVTADATARERFIKHVADLVEEYARATRQTGNPATPDPEDDPPLPSEPTDGSPDRRPDR